MTFLGICVLGAMWEMIGLVCRLRGGFSRCKLLSLVEVRLYCLGNARYMSLCPPTSSRSYSDVLLASSFLVFPDTPHSALGGIFVP